MRSTSLATRRVVLLIFAGLIGVFAVLPHPLDHLAEFFGGGLVVAIAAIMGTRFAPSASLGTPFIDAVLNGERFVRRALSIATSVSGSALF